MVGNPEDKVSHDMTQIFCVYFRSPEVPMPTPKSKLSGIQSQISGRRSKQARLRAIKMRKMYGLDRVRTYFSVIKVGIW